jgi:hypothetical protein
LAAWPEDDRNAENLATEMLSGKAMKELHQHGHGKDDPEMAYIHELGNAALAYIQVLKKMSTAASRHH